MDAETVADTGPVRENAIQQSIRTGATSILPSASPMQMIDRALANNAGIDVLEKLFDLQVRFESNESRKAFNNAIADAKSEIKPIVKDGHVFFQSKDKTKPDTDFRHETLAGIAKHIDPILAKYGLSYRYRSEQLEGGMIRVTCILSHRGGYSEETSLQGSRDDSGSKNNYQAVGSAVTYLQRYTIKLALGLSAAKDNDAGSAGPDDNDTGPGLISLDQFDRIRERLALIGLEDDVVCRAQKIRALSDLPADCFEPIMKKLAKTAETKGITL